MAEERFYDQEEAEAILRLASQHHNPTTIDRQQLLRTAGEIGISPEALNKAEIEYGKLKISEQQKVEENLLWQEFRRSRRAGLMGHFLSYVCVNIGLVATYFFTSPGGYFWPMWPLLGWSIGLASHAITAFSNGGKGAFQVWLQGRRAMENARQLRTDSLARRSVPMEEFLTRLVQNGVSNKIEAIKIYRESTGADLMAAKQIVDDFESRHPGIFF